MLKEKILAKKPGIITYGITPPKKSNPPEKIHEIAYRQMERIRELPVDGLVIYDIQDEKERTDKIRPFPFIETVDPLEYSTRFLTDLAVPRIIYRCVGKFQEHQFRSDVLSEKSHDAFSVFVGAASRNQQVSLRLSEAYSICADANPHLMIGGVVIPERHIKTADEHLRIWNKQDRGCRYFISQAVYNLQAAKDFLSDYYYYCKDNNREMVPILFTLTPCGSVKTLEFMRWLGISIPRWLQNDLMHSEDILERSVYLAKEIFNDLYSFACEKNIPVGCNIESVSVRKVEIDASIALTREIKTLMGSFSAD